MSAILIFDFQKKKTNTFFWSKLSKLHKKDPNLHVATTFSLKQGETRTNHGSIPHPLSFLLVYWQFFSLFRMSDIGKIFQTDKSVDATYFY